MKPPKYAKSRAVAALPPYFGGKRKLAPMIGRYLRDAGYGPECGLPLLDGFTGGGATAMYFKRLGYETHTNDISFRSHLLGQALIENSRRKITPSDLERFYAFTVSTPGVVMEMYTPQHFSPKHGKMIDRLVQFAQAQPEAALKALFLLAAWKYLIRLRPMTQFNSPNAFNIPLEDGRFDEIKSTYDGVLKTALKAPRTLLSEVIEEINAGVVGNGKNNTATQGDAIEFVQREGPCVVYLDPPYPNTLGYNANYAIVDDILTNSMTPRDESGFSGKEAWHFIEQLLLASAHHPIIAVSLGNAGGKNELHELTDLIRKARPEDEYRFDTVNYAHNSAVASEEFTAKNQEWLCLAWRPR